MGVTYKLRDEVVSFIISQRQENPLSSCRQLAESASQRFGLQLSKSSVHDVLRESGVVTPRGRKPKDKFQIPAERKKQIQQSLSQVKLLAPPPTPVIQKTPPPVIQAAASSGTRSEPKAPLPLIPRESPSAGQALLLAKDPKDFEISAQYPQAGRIFQRAALWDLGIFSQDRIKEADWQYYLTYAKGVNVFLENNKSFFITLPLPLERCVMELADGLINNVTPLIVGKVSDQDLFKGAMDEEAGFKIISVSIVDSSYRILLEIKDIMERKRGYLIKNRFFVESLSKDAVERARTLFFSQTIDPNEFIDNILNLNGFDTTSKHEIVVNLLVGDDFKDRAKLSQAAEKLNGMYLRDEQGRLVSVKVEN